MLAGSRCAAVVLASALLAGPALADPRPPTERDRKLASELVKKAIAQSSAGDHAAAIEIYNQAYTLVPNSLLLSNIGAEFQQEGMLKEALDYFCRYLKEDPAGTNAPYALSQAKILRRQLGKKKVEDRDVCATPRTEEPPDDDARIRTTDRGDRSERAVRSDKGDRTEKGDRTDKDRTEKPDRLDRNDKSGRGDKSEHRPGGGPVAETHASASSGGHATLMYVGIGAGIAGLAAVVTGTVYGVRAKNASDQINGHDPTTPWPDNIRTIEADGQYAEDRQVLWLMIGGVLVTTGVVLFVVGRSDEAPDRGDKTAVRVVPTGNGVAVFGRF